MADGMTRAQPGSLVAALCLVQAQAVAINKSTKGARSKYAPLDEVLASMRPLLAHNGIAITQTTHVEGDLMLLRTTLRHVGGESIEGDYPVCAVSRAPQDMGSALTYARRYALLAICGVHPSDEDDDGEKATNNHKATETTRARAAAPASQAPDRAGGASPAQPDRVAAYVNTQITNIRTMATLDDLERYVDDLFDGAAWKKLETQHPEHVGRVRAAIANRIDALNAEPVT